MKRKRNAFAAILLILALLVTGCGNGASQDAESQGTSAAVNAEGRIVEYASEDLDATWDASSATKIQLNGTTIQVDGKGANASGSTLTITDGGSYVLSGTLTDGQILVEAGDKDTVRLILNGVEITNQDNAVIYSKSSQKTILTLAEGSVNIVADQGEYKLAEGQDDPDATIFSKSDLTINGTGSLTVQANYNHGIHTKDDLVITGGNLSITAKNDGLKGKDSIAIKDGTFIVKVEGDAISGDNNEEASMGWVVIDGGSFEITAGDDAFHAESDLTMNTGTINIKTCTEGLEGMIVTINGGDIKLVSTDDAVNAAGGFEESESGEQYVVRINGGTLTIDAAGDGLDSNGSLYLEGGTVYLSGPTNDGNGPMDYNLECTVNGGVYGIAGSAGMAQYPQDASTQYSLTVIYTTLQKAGTQVSLVDESGKQIFSYTPTKDYQSIVISTPDLTQGATYSLKAGDVETTKVTLSKTVTRINETGGEAAAIRGPGGPGGSGHGGDRVKPDMTSSGAIKPPMGGTPPDGMQPPIN